MGSSKKRVGQKEEESESKKQNKPPKRALKREYGIKKDNSVLKQQLKESQLQLARQASNNRPVRHSFSTKQIFEEVMDSFQCLNNP